MYKNSNKVMNYLNTNNSGKNKKSNLEILKLIFKWTKIFLMIFIIVSMLWGCAQMYQSNYNVAQVLDLSGKKIYSPGTTFEIIISYFGEKGAKDHHFSIDKDSIIEYGYFSISNWGEAFSKTGSPFYGFFVYPLAWLLVSFIKMFSGTLEPNLSDESQNKYGWSAFGAILLIVILIKLFTLAISWKTQMNQEKTQQLQLKVADIQAKYQDNKSMEARQKQQMEISNLYKKEGISQFGPMLTSFAPMPFLFAIYAVVRSSRALKIAKLGSISFIETPWEKITSGEYIYITLIAIYIPLQALSMMLPTLFQFLKQSNVGLSEAQKKSRKKQLYMQIVMMFVMMFVVTSIASGVCIYWILSSFFQVIQTIAFHFYLNNKKNKRSKEVMRRLKQQNKK